MEQFMKNCSLWERPRLEKFTVSRGRSPTMEQRKSGRRKQQQRQYAMN